MSKKKISWIALGVVLTILLIVAVGLIKPAKETESADKTSKLVQVETVIKSKAQRWTELSGSLEANEKTVLSFEVPGRLLELNYKQGDQISLDTVLAKISASEYSLQVAKTNAGVNKSKVGYEQALKDFERMEKLYQQGAVSQSDYDKVRDRLRVAEEDYLLAQESASLITPEKTSLVAPFNSTILTKHTTDGQTVAAGSPIYTIGQLSPLKVVLPVPDSDIANWQVGDKVSLNLYANERQAQVTRIYPATNSDTGTVGVEVTVPNPNKDWLPGQVVIANRSEQREGLFVPVSSVINRGEKKPYVFLSVDGKAVKKAVTIGELFGDKLEVIDGLESGSKIVIKGADQLFNGDDIKEPGGSEK
ncbi:MAG: efflux RND transporter periplasmic adaptor subunit [Firmicutes bacterium]|nr:efflux RND transporter periplasmic adaptor subunit [Bacillota bacterium]